MTRRQADRRGRVGIFGSMWGGLDIDITGGKHGATGNGKDAWMGWPTAQKLAGAARQWLHALGYGDAERPLAAESQTSV